jgi:TPR repeat protein
LSIPLPNASFLKIADGREGVGMGLFSFIQNLFTPDPEVDFQYGLREDSFSGDYPKAAWLYQKAADRGHHKAKYFLALMCFEGKGVQEDRAKGLKLLTESADSGYGKAIELMAEIDAGRYPIS